MGLALPALKRRYGAPGYPHGIAMKWTQRVPARGGVVGDQMTTLPSGGSRFGFGNRTPLEPQHRYCRAELAGAGGLALVEGAGSRPAGGNAALPAAAGRPTERSSSGATEVSGTSCFSTRVITGLSQVPVTR
jgi:hypothetical protein